MNRKLIIVIMVVLVSLCAVVSETQAFDLVVKEKHGFVGKNRIPYSIYTIKKPSDYSDLASWINNYYSNDNTQTIHVLPETMLQIRVSGKKAIAFKAWEFEGLTQNILIDKSSNTLSLISTPHFPGNLDGSVVFKQMLNFTLPANEYTNLTDTDYQPNISAECDEEVEFSSDTDSSSSIKAQATTCSYKCSDNKVIGSYNGISAYSNGQYTGTGTACGSNSYGYKWQCPEYVVRFYSKIYNRWVKGGNAKEYCSRADEKNLNRRWNCDPGQPNVPWPGDIIVKTSGTWGHVGVVKEVGTNYIKVVSQNYSCSAGEQTLSMTRKKNSQGIEYACVNIYGQTGYKNGCWLWPK